MATKEYIMKGINRMEIFLQHGLTKNKLHTEQSNSLFDFFKNYKEEYFEKTKYELKSFKKQDALYILPCEMTKPERKRGNIESRLALTIDIDNTDGDTYEEVVSKVKDFIGSVFDNSTFIIYPTVSSSTATPRCRVIVFTDRGLTESENKLVLAFLEANFPYTIDSAGMSFSQLVGLPVKTEWNSSQTMNINENDYLSTDALIERLTEGQLLTETQEMAELSSVKALDFQEAVMLVSKYVNRNQAYLDAYPFYLNCHLVIAKAVHTGEVSQQTADYLVRLLAGSNLTHQENNVKRLYEEDGSAVELPYTIAQWFGDEKSLDNLWYTINENGKVRVDPAKLGEKIIESYPLLRCPSLEFGMFYTKAGVWTRRANLKSYIDKLVQIELNGIGAWTQNIANATRHYVWSAIYNESLLTNPLDDSDPFLVSFENGTYDIRTDTLREHRKEDFVGILHPYALDTSSRPAQATNAWLADLTDPETTLYLKQLIGYCFYRGHGVFNEFTIFTASGGNGKSTVTNLIKNILGAENVSAIPLEKLGNSNDRFSSSTLYQKSANLMADVSSDFIQSTSLIKSLTGGDFLSAEFKGKDSFQFINHAKLIFSANTLPAFNDHSEGFRRRLRVVQFSKMIDEDFKARHDLKKIYEEIPCFAYECIRAFAEVMDQTETYESPSMKEAKDQWINENYHVKRFVEERLEKEVSSSVECGRVYDHYAVFCLEENLKALSATRFKKQMADLGFTQVRPKAIKDGQRPYHYKGIGSLV